MVWFIVAAVAVAAVVLLLFRMRGEKPMEEPEAEHRGDDRDRMI